MPLTKAWVISVLIAQIALALTILPQDKKVKENSQERTLLKSLDNIFKTESIKIGQERRSNYVEKMLLRTFNQDYKALRQPKPKHMPPFHRAKVAAEPMLTPQKAIQAQRDEEELMKLTQGSAKSALLGNPYVEKKGRNDYLVIQSDTVDPFVTVIPNNIYYNIEKKCVNWLDACSLRGIRDNLLKRVQSPYK